MRALLPILLGGRYGFAVGTVTGVATRAVSLALIPVLLGATWVHSGNGWVFSSEGGGWEFPAFWALTLWALALLGDGAYAVGKR